MNALTHFKETYGETFWRQLISFEREMTEKTLPSETRISRENVERTKQVSYKHYDILVRNKVKF